MAISKKEYGATDAKPVVLYGLTSASSENAIPVLVDGTGAIKVSVSPSLDSIYIRLDGGNGTGSLDAYYIRLDGSTTTAASIPFQYGIGILSGQIIDFNYFDYPETSYIKCANKGTLDFYSIFDSGSTINFFIEDSTKETHVFGSQGLTYFLVSGATSYGFFFKTTSGWIQYTDSSANQTTLVLSGGNFLSSATHNLFSGDVSMFKNIETQGLGVPAIYKVGRSTGQTAANTSVVTYTTPAADGTYLVSANVLVTTATLHNFTVTVDYTDEDNTARTATLPFSVLAGTFVTAITNASGAVPYTGMPIHIRCKASTAITVKTVGTFTTVTYNVEGIIQQLA